MQVIAAQIKGECAGEFVLLMDDNEIGIPAVCELKLRSNCSGQLLRAKYGRKPSQR